MHHILEVETNTLACGESYLLVLFQFLSQIGSGVVLLSIHVFDQVNRDVFIVYPAAWTPTKAMLKLLVFVVLLLSSGSSSAPRLTTLIVVVIKVLVCIVISLVGSRTLPPGRVIDFSRLQLLT